MLASSQAIPLSSPPHLCIDPAVSASKSWPWHLLTPHRHRDAIGIGALRLDTNANHCAQMRQPRTGEAPPGPGTAGLRPTSSDTVHGQRCMNKMPTFFFPFCLQYTQSAAIMGPEHGLGPLPHPIVTWLPPFLHVDLDTHAGPLPWPLCVRQLHPLFPAGAFPNTHPAETGQDTSVSSAPQCTTCTSTATGACSKHCHCRLHFADEGVVLREAEPLTPGYTAEDMGGCSGPGTLALEHKLLPLPGCLYLLSNGMKNDLPNSGHCPRAPGHFPLYVLNYKIYIT